MSNIDPTVPTYGHSTTQSVRDNFGHAKSEIEALQAAISGIDDILAPGPFLPIAGGQLVGPLILATDPAAPLEAATRRYVDNHLPLGGPFLPTAGGAMLGGIAFNTPPAAADYANLTGFLDLHGANHGIQVSYGKPPQGGTLTVMNYVSAGWHNWVLGAGDHMTLDQETLSVGTPAARAEPEWAGGSTWGGAGRFVGVNTRGVMGLVIKNDRNATYPVGTTGWGILRAASAGFNVFGIFGRADLYATGAANNEFNTFNFAGTPSGRIPPIYTNGSGDFNTFCLSCFAYGDYPSSFGLLIDKATQRFQTGIYVGPAACTLWQMVLDATATDDLPANGALLIKHKGGVGLPLQIQITGAFIGANPVFSVTDNLLATRFSINQGGGASFGNQTVAATDLSHHIALYSTTYGFNVVAAGAINVVAGAAVAGVFNNVGLQSCNIGGAVPAAGTFTSVKVGTIAGPTITAGTGAPAATAPAGSIFIRSDGAAGTRIYVNQTGTTTWAAIAGV